MRVILRADKVPGVGGIHVDGLVPLNGRPHWIVDAQKTDGYLALLQKVQAADSISPAQLLEAVRGRVLLPWDWLEPIECFAKSLPNEMPDGFAAEPLGEADALRDEGFEYVVYVSLTKALWEDLSGEFDPALSLSELMEELGFGGVLLPPDCPL